MQTTHIVAAELAFRIFTDHMSLNNVVFRAKWKKAMHDVHMELRANFQEDEKSDYDSFYKSWNIIDVYDSERYFHDTDIDDKWISEANKTLDVYEDNCLNCQKFSIINNAGWCSKCVLENDEQNKKNMESYYNYDSDSE